MRRRSGFTLTELLVVIAILLVLSTLAFAVFNSGRSSDRMRSGARTAQSAFLGAKDRALHAKTLRGLRLTRDPNNLNLINGFVYLQPLPLQSAGNTGGATPNDFDITRPGVNKNPPYTDATQIILFGQVGLPSEGQTLYNQDAAGLWPSTSLQIRIPSTTGQWFQLSRQSNSPPYWITPDPNNAANGTNNYWMFLQTGYPGGNVSPKDAILPTDVSASCDIQLGNDVLPFHQPITLPAGVVIDLAFSNSTVQTLAGYSAVTPNPATPYLKPAAAIPTPVPNIDVMFSPRGNVTGSVSALGALFFCLRGMQDASLGLDPAYDKRDPNYPQVPGDSLILAVFPQTGLVQTFELDLTDAVINATGVAGSDGAADNIFNYAQRGMSAGR